MGDFKKNQSGVVINKNKKGLQQAKLVRKKTQKHGLLEGRVQRLEKEIKELRAILVPYMKLG